MLILAERVASTAALPDSDVRGGFEAFGGKLFRLWPSLVWGLVMSLFSLHLLSEAPCYDFTGFNSLNSHNKPKPLILSF